jgi:hypothetical protein
MLTRRRFLADSMHGAVAGGVLLHASAGAQTRVPPAAQDPSMTLLNPRMRVPVGFIIDDSTCLVNLNRFAIPQFDQAHKGARPDLRRDWRSWPVEIPDDFVRRFMDWCGEHGVKGKYSIVPYPACVGRIDRLLPGWTQRELDDSLALVRNRVLPDWDIHPEMVTHTRVIDLKTGHPYADDSLAFMENWDWTTGKSADELTAYLAYALDILKAVGLPCEGVTTPGGFGARVLPALARASHDSVRHVFGAEIPHYFRHAVVEGPESVVPRIEAVGGLDTDDPRVVVSVIACTGDWTGGWDNTPPENPDRYITADLSGGRLVEVIDRGEPALLLSHWTGIHWNGEARGFSAFQEVVRRLHAKYDHLLWMKLSDLSRYWAARTLTRLERDGSTVRCRAPFACPAFTVRVSKATGPARLAPAGAAGAPLREVSQPTALVSGTWLRQGADLVVCWDLPKGASELRVG